MSKIFANHEKDKMEKKSANNSREEMANIRKSGQRKNQIKDLEKKIKEQIRKKIRKKGEKREKVIWPVVQVVVMEYG